MHRFTTIGLACLALAFVAGCGDDASDTSSTPPAAPPAETATAPIEATESEPAGDAVEVGMKDIKFMPEKVTAKVGQKILWTNDEDVPHNVTATDGADFASETLNKDDTYEFTPAKAGLIKYVCTIHSGQSGEIDVTAG